MKARHHAGTHNVQAQRVRDAARANPQAVCWRDGLTLTQHPSHGHTGKPNDWTAGHTIDGYPNPPTWLDVERVPPPGAWLAPEVTCCNYSHGARRTNGWRNNPRSADWFGA